MSAIQDSFFNEKLPLVPKNKAKCSNICLPNDFSSKLSLVKKLAITTSLLGVATLGYFTYESTRTLTENEIDDPKSILSLLILGADGVLLSIASCYFIAIKRFRNNLLNSFPHRDYYVGSTWTFYYNRIERIELKIDRTYLPTIEAFISEMQERGIWDTWIGIKKFSDVKGAKNYFLTELKKGLCFGNSMELLSLMPKFSKTPSNDLILKLNFEKKIYFQLFDTFIHDLLRNEENICVILGHSWKRDPSDEEIRSEVEFLPQVSTREYLFLRFIGLEREKFIYHCIELQKVSEITIEKIMISFAEAIQKVKNSAKQSNNREPEITGTIHLQPDPKNKGSSGHALFFQFSDTYLRFHDSGHTLPGFFEFPSQKLFFEGLLQHINTWPDYKEGLLSFTFVSFLEPHQNKNPTIVIET